MPAPVTQIYVASQTARELIIVDPPYSLVGSIFIVFGLLVLVIGYAALCFVRLNLARPWQVLVWLLPVIIGGPLLALGLGIGAGTTRVTLSTDTGALSVQKTILSVAVHSQRFPLAQVRSAQVGVGDVCRFLYVNLADGRSETLLGCTDRTGYSEAAGAINAFVKASRP
jgi:hypothetical protein